MDGMIGARQEDTFRTYRRSAPSTLAACWQEELGLRVVTDRGVPAGVVAAGDRDEGGGICAGAGRQPQYRHPTARRGSA
jgi:hypothetical protein